MSTTMKRRGRNLTLLALVSVMLMGLGAPAYAADGQVLGGDNDIASNVTDAGSTAKVTLDAGSVLNDCPIGMTTCVMEYRWRAKKDCFLCYWSNDTSWIVLGTGKTTLNHCKAAGNYRFELQVRLTWLAPQTKTVEMWGGYETIISVDLGTIVTKVLPEGVFNVTNNYGWKGSVKVQTDTAVSAAISPYTFAPSGSTYISTSC